MGYLIALGLFVAFCAALLHPYGRRLLLTMFLVLVGILGTALAVMWLMARSERPQSQPDYAPAVATPSEGAQRPQQTTH